MCCALPEPDNAFGVCFPRQDLLNIARTTLSSKILTHDKDHFAELAVDAVLRLRGSTNLEAIQIIKKPGGTLKVPHLASQNTILHHVIFAAIPTWTSFPPNEGTKACRQRQADSQVSGASRCQHQVWQAVSMP